MSDEYEIRLKPDAKPHALFTARHVPIPLREKVRTELQRMEDLGVISKIDQPTPWCAGMVVVPKKSGEVCIKATEFKCVERSASCASRR